MRGYNNGAKMANLTKEQRHKIMSHVRSCNTKPEIVLRNALWHRGIRYRKNYGDLPGKPDMAIMRYRIAIFVDGDFWHGRDMEKTSSQIKNNRDYWIPKLQRNKMRDAEVNDLLTEQGWLVLRFWESDIEKHLDKCLETIVSYIPNIIINKQMKN